MFTPYLHTCLQDVLRHVNSIFEDIPTPYLKKFLQNVGRHVNSLWTFAYTKVFEMFTKYSITCLQPVWNTGHDKVLWISQLSMSLDEKYCTYSNSPFHGDYENTLNSILQ